MNKKVIASILSLAMCGSLVTGATYALFTSESETNIAINSGKVKMVATLGNLQTFSAVAKEDKSGYDSVKQDEGKFLNEGTAAIEENTITLDKMTPGDKATFDIVLKNESNVAIQYQTLIKSVADSGLFSGLVITVEEETFTGATVVSEWTALKANAQPEDNVISVSVELPVGAKNEYQETSTDLAVNVNAVQGNAIVEEVDPEVTYLYSAADLISFEKSVNEGGNNYLGKTVKMMDTIDLKNIPFTPIGQSGNTTFMGNFDGNGYAIKNLNIAVTGDDDTNNAGLFGWYAAANDTSISISNLTIEHATVKGDDKAGVIVGYLDPNVGDVTIDNCRVVDATLFGGRAGAIAGFVGTSGASSTAVPTISNSSIEDVTVAAYKSMGEVVGYSYDNYVQTNVSVTDVELKTMACNDAQLTRILKDLKQDSEEKTVYLAAGEYNLPTNLSVNWGVYNVNLIGATNADGTPATVMNVPAEVVDYTTLSIQGTIANIVFEDETNSKYIWFTDSNGTYRHIEIDNCVFDGASLRFNASANITDCVFDGNGEAWSGIQYAYPQGDVVIDGCTFGGYCFTNLQVTDEGAHKDVSVTVKNCTIGALSENAVDSAEGVTIYVDTIVLENNTIDCDVWTPSFASVTKTNNVTSEGGEVTYKNW